MGIDRCRRNEVPQPFKAVPQSHEVEYLNDLRLYDAENCSWHGIKATGTLPEEYAVHLKDAALAQGVGNTSPFPEGRYGKQVLSTVSGTVLH